MASSDLARLVVRLEAQTSSYQAELEKAKRQLGKFDSDVSKIAGKIGKRIGVAIAGAATGIAFAVKQSLDAADELGNLSEKVGVSVEELSKLQYAAKLSDVSVEQLQTGLIRLSKSAVEAAAGTGDSATAFKALGVEAKKADGTLKSTDELFTELAGAFAKFEDGPEKAAAAMAIFGKSGTELIPLLNQGKQGIQAFGAELEKLGGVVTAEAAANADEFNRNLDRLKAASGGLANQIATALSPSLVELTAKIVAFTSNGENSQKAVDGLKVAFRGLAGTITVVSNLFQIAGDNIAAVAASAVAVARGDFAGALEVMRARSEDFKKDLDDIVHAFDETKPAAKEMGQVAVTATTEAAKSTLNYAAAVEQAKNKTKEAKEETQQWADMLALAQAMQEEEDARKAENKETESRQAGISLDSASSFDEEIKRMREAEAEKTDILQSEEEARSRIREDALGAGLDALGFAGEAALSMGKKGFKAFKAFAIAQTIIDTYAAAQATYKSLATIPIVGPGLAIAGAGAAIAAGLTRVAAIRAAEPSGYMTGGYTGDGPKGEVAGVVHRGEYVLNSQAVEGLDAMNDGRMPWDHARVEAETQYNIINNAPGIKITPRQDGITIDALPELMSLFESQVASGITTGRSSISQAIGNKFGVQQRAVR